AATNAPAPATATTRTTTLGQSARFASPAGAVTSEGIRPPQTPYGALPSVPLEAPPLSPPHTSVTCEAPSLSPASSGASPRWAAPRHLRPDKPEHASHESWRVGF